MSEGPAKVWLDRDGKLLRVRLNRPKANVVDAEMIGALQSMCGEFRKNKEIYAVLIDAEGPHFSFGASVEEHLPDQCAQMLRALHSLVISMLRSRVPILVAVQGQCLGGGLEVALAGTLLFAHPEAQLGQPETQLAVFAPAGSCFMPHRMGQARADDMLLSGRSISGAEALDCGLVDFTADDPSQAALDYFDQHYAGKSLSTLKLAYKASRMGYVGQIIEKLHELEDIYLNDLMATHDAVEGLEAFLGKRKPKWENR